MSQLARHLVRRFARGYKHDVQESLYTFNEDHNNKWYSLRIKELTGDYQVGNSILTFYEVQQMSVRKRLVHFKF